MLNRSSPRRLLSLLCCLVAQLLFCAPSGAASAPALRAYGADLRQTTVSGLSSGAYMAGQFAVAYSDLVAGVGLVAGGPYYCAGYPGQRLFVPYLSNAMSVCMNPADAGTTPPDAAVLWRQTQDFARAGHIDNVANLGRQRVYLFSGSRDATVTTEVVDQAQRFYQLAGVAPQKLLYDKTVAAGHGFITDVSGDVECGATASPFINNCRFKQAEVILRHLYPDLQPAGAQAGKIVSFNQRSFVRNSRSSMANTAYAYVPDSCLARSCRVHVAFHGCRQGVEAIGDHFYARAGYNRLAAANHIIVLYPQVEPSPLYPYNPRGCWDFWGYTSVDPFYPDFYKKSGTQSAAVKAMLERLAEPRAP